MRSCKQVVLKGKFAYVGYVRKYPDVENLRGYVEVYTNQSQTNILCELYYPDSILDVNKKLDVGIYGIDFLSISDDRLSMA